MEEDVVSLSAILLDKDYYWWIMQGKHVLHDVPIVDPEHLIPLKVQAWLNLSVRKAKGESIDSRDIKKHKNDVFRLLSIINMESIGEVPKSIKDDLVKFINAMNNEIIPFENLGLGKHEKAEIFNILRIKYGIDKRDV